MRRFLTAALVVCAAAALFLDAQAAAESAAAVIPINVRIKCDGEAVGEVTINGRVLVDNNLSTRLSKSAGDTAMFTLLGGSDVTTVTVAPKEGVAWPFVDAPPTFGSRGDRGTGAISADAATTIYGYNFLVTCGSTPRVIDPKMDIVP